jgi:primosomal protein N' (replication factor Y)
MAERVRGAIAAQKLAVRVLGPAPAPVARLKGNYRFHVQLSAAAVEHLQQLWNSVRDELKPAGNVEFAVDVDPINMR